MNFLLIVDFCAIFTYKSSTIIKSPQETALKARKAMTFISRWCRLEKEAMSILDSLDIQHCDQADRCLFSMAVQMPETSPLGTS